MSDTTTSSTTGTSYAIADAIAEMYIGKVIQIYLGEAGGTTKYSDYDIEQKIYIEGKVLWAKGLVIALQCDIVTPARTYRKQILINAWGISAVMPVSEEDNVQISHIIQGTRR